MKDIEKILQRNSIEDVNIPSSVENKIHYALNHLENKSGKINYLKRIITAFISTILALLGSVTVYATLGGTIGGRPVFEWATNIKFSDQYEEYKTEIEGEYIAHNKTTMKLVSTLCDDSYILLEFDVKFSEEDKQLMKLGENYITEKDFENLEQVEDEMMRQHLFKHYTEYKNDINTFYAEFQEVFINDKQTWLGKTQTVTKISDYEYKVYYIFFITDQNWNGENQIKLTLKNGFINTDTIRLNGEYGNYKLHNITEGSGGNFYMDGEINVDVSKEKALKNTEIIIPENTEAKYKNMTKTVEKIELTPMQIIVRISTQIDNVSMKSLSSRKNKDYIGITDFNVLGEEGQELIATNYETRRTITYADGTVEEWSRGDIGTYKEFSNATMNLEEIIIIEKKADTKNIKIVPTVKEEIDRVDGNTDIQKIEYGEFNIKIKD